MSEPYVFEKDTRTVGFTSAEFGNVWAVSRGELFQTNDLTPFQEEWRSWLADHDAKVRADQIEKDVAIAHRVRIGWHQGDGSFAAAQIEATIRAQLTGPTS